MWVLLAFGSAFFAGVTSILAKTGIKNTDSSVATALRTIVVLAFAWLMVFITGSQGGIKDISGRPLLFLTLSGLSTGASWLCYFKALKIGEIHKVVPIDKTSTILSMVFAFIFLGEPVSAAVIISILLIGAGTFLMVHQKKSGKSESAKGWMIYAALSAVFAALTAILGKIGIENIESNLGTAIRTVIVLMMAWAVVFASKKGKQIKSVAKKDLLFIALSGLSTGASWLCYFKALQSGLASIVVPIDKLSIIVTIAFSYFVFKEKLSRKALAGLIVLTAGTLLLVL